MTGAVWRRGRRAGFTIVEMSVAIVIGLFAVGGMIAVFLSIGRMSKAGDLSSALQEAALTMAIIQQDLSQAVLADPASQKVISEVKPGTYRFLRGAFQDDGTIKAECVVYSIQETAGKNFSIVRKFEDRASPLRGIFSKRTVLFQQLEGAGGPFVRVSLAVSTHDTDDHGQPKGGAEETVISSLIRVAGPEMAASKLVLGDLIRKGVEGCP